MPKCSELARTLFDIAREHVRNGSETIDDVVSIMRSGLPQLDRARLVNSINEVMDSNAKSRSDFSKRLERLKREARKDKVGQEKLDAIQKAIADETVLAKGEKRTTQLPTEAIADLQAKINDLMAHYAKTAPAIKAKYEDQIRRSAARLADDGVRVPRVKPEVIEKTQELQKLRFERDELKNQVLRKVARLKEKPRLHKVVEAANVIRHMMVTGEFSGVGRQAFFSLAAFPERTKTSIYNMFASFASPETSHKINQAFKDDWDVQRFHAAGVPLIQESSGEYTQIEEALFGRIADFVPGPLKGVYGKTAGRYFDAFDRAYTTFLNAQRVGVAKGMLDYTTDATPTEDELKAIGHIAMVTTGRADLKSFDQYAPAANATLFAARYQISRLQYLAGTPIWKSATPEMRKQTIARFYARPIAGMLGLYAAASLFYGDDDRFNLSLDPRHADFGKIVIGKTRLDPMAGLAQTLRFGVQAATGQRITAKGETQDLRGPNKKFGAPDIFSNFLRAKLAPAPGLVWDWIKGENLVGEPTTVASTLTNVGTPLTYHDIYDVLRSELNVPEKAAISAMAMFGLGVSVYQDRAKKAKKPQLQF